MKRVMMTCDRCNEMIPINGEMEFHILSPVTGADSRLEICQKCFEAFLTEFLGVMVEGGKEIVKESEGDTASAGSGNEIRDSKPEATGTERRESDQPAKRKEGK